MAKRYKFNRPQSAHFLLSKPGDERYMVYESGIREWSYCSTRASWRALPYGISDANDITYLRFNPKKNTWTLSRSTMQQVKQGEWHRKLDISFIIRMEVGRFAVFSKQKRGLKNLTYTHTASKQCRVSESDSLAYGPTICKVLNGLFEGIGAEHQYFHTLNRNLESFDLTHTTHITGPFLSIIKEQSLKVACQKILGGSSKTHLNLLKVLDFDVSTLRAVKYFLGRVPMGIISKDEKSAASFEEFCAFLSGNFLPKKKYSRYDVVPLKHILNALGEVHSFHTTVVDSPKLRLLNDAMMQMRSIPEVVIPELMQDVDAMHPETLKEWHDAVVRVFSMHARGMNKIKMAEPIVLSHEIEGAKALLSMASVGEWTLRLPDTRSHIFDWGSEMHHCISGYADTHAAGRCILLGLYKGDQLMYNIMLDTAFGDAVLQFYGKYNCLPQDRECVDAFEALAVSCFGISISDVSKWYPKDKDPIAPVAQEIEDAEQF